MKRLKDRIPFHQPLRKVEEAAVLAVAMAVCIKGSVITVVEFHSVAIEIQ